jgi:hypothetical protein
MLSQLPLETLLNIFMSLTPRQREKIKTVSKSFHIAYIKSLQTRRIVNPKEHIFFRINKRKNNVNMNLLFYEIDHVELESGNIFFKGKRKKETTSKTKILYNKYNLPYTKLNDEFIYLYEKKFKKEILKDKCDKCKEWKFSFECGIMNEYCNFDNCKNRPFYYYDLFDFTKIDIVNSFCRHNICYKCMIKLTWIHLKITLFDHVHKTFIVRSKGINLKKINKQ